MKDTPDRNTFRESSKREDSDPRNDLDIQQKLRDEGVSRRDFLAYTSALGMSTALGTSLWSNRAEAAMPKRGGHLKAALNDANTADNLDPATFNATTMIVISRAFRDSLVEVGQDNSAAPALAESWEASADAKTWRFTLRKGVEFSNGKSLTTEDVIDSINVHRGENSTSGAAGVFAGITDVKADGKNVVVVTLNEPNADFPFLMTDYHMNIMPSLGNGKADVKSTIGTGVYLLKRFEPGVASEFERNPNAWQQDFGFFDSAEILAINDNNARQTALVSGDVDVINRPELKTIQLLARQPGINIQAVKSNLAFTHPMRVNVAPFDNNDFRQALKHALPRQEFVDKILFGYGSVGNDQPLGPAFLSYDEELQNEYDLDKAKSLIKKAGMDGQKIQMHVSDTPYNGALDAAALFQQSFKKIGVDMEIVRAPADGYWNEIWNKKPFSACYWGPRPVEDMILSICYITGAPWNDTLISIPRVDELVAAARGELDAVKRKAMYKEVQMLIARQGATLIPAFGTDNSATRDNIGVPEKIGGGWEMDGGHFVKRWWMKG